MSIELVASVWGVLRDHIDSHDRKDAADELVNLLIDSDYAATDIKVAFRGDRDISAALKFYVERQDSEEYDSDEDEEDSDEW